MDDWLDKLLPAAVFATLAAGTIYAISVIPFGHQSIWDNQTAATQAERAAIHDCVFRTEDLTNGEFTELDTGRMRECKKTIGGGKKK